MIIKILVLDVDGTLTDGKINISDNGELFKSFSVKDGYGIIQANKNNVIPIIITGRNSIITGNRCEELGIKHIYQGIDNKKELLIQLSKDMQFSLEEVAYIGDDLNDLDCMKVCGLVGCPNDAVEGVKKIAHFISKYKGGEGAVREFIDYILEQ